MPLKGDYSFVGSNGFMSQTFPLTVLTEKELKTPAQRKTLKEAKAIDQRFDGIAIVTYSPTNERTQACSVKLATSTYNLK